LQPDKNQETLNMGYKQELKRALSLGDLVIYGLIFMVPIAPFGIYGEVAVASEGMPALVYSIGMVTMIFTAMSYSTMSREFPISGSVYAYASRGLSKTIGFFSGWIIIMDYFLIPALLIIVSAAAMSAIVPGMPIWIWAIVFVLINTFVNVIGIDWTARFNKIVLILELIVFALFMIFAIKAVANGVNGTEFTIKPFYNQEVFSMSSVMGAVSIGVLSYLGFDAISTLGEETKGGAKTIGTATILALFLVGFCFITLTWIAACLWPDQSTFDNIDTAFYAVAEAAGGTWLMWLTSIATAFAWGIADALVAQSAISRVMYSMSRDGFLPKPLSKVHEKYKTPYVAAIFIGIVTLIISIAFGNVERGIGAIASLINFGALSCFLVLHVTVVVHFFIKKKTGQFIRHLILPIVGFVIIAYVWISLDMNSKILGFSWLAVGVVYFIVLKFVLKREIKDFGL